jgi:lysophospholipid hydrolase
MEIHTTGYAWRYIRASMTLTGFLPPMTDEEGNMLVDGGYMDNLTVFLSVAGLMVGCGNERYGS